nr:PREDICTED: G-protein coupled receptor 4-like [Lepisosteus oculatus]
MNHSNFTSCDKIDFSADQTFLPVLYGCIFCMGLPTNCLALYGLYRLVKANYTLPIYAINLLLADLVQIATLPFWIDYFKSGHTWHFGDIACKIIGSVFYISLAVSILFMCCISLERYLAIVHPLWFQGCRKLRNVYALCLAVWLFIILIVSVGVSIALKRPQDSKLCMESHNWSKTLAIFQLVTPSIVFVIPLLLLVFLSLLVHRSLAQSLSFPEQEKRRISGLLLLIVLLFLLIFGPYHFVKVVLYAGSLAAADKCDFKARVFTSYQISIGLLSVNALLDPMIYIFIYRDTRKKMLDSLPCFRWMRKSTVNSSQ